MKKAPICCATLFLKDNLPPLKHGLDYGLVTCTAAVHILLPEIQNWAGPRAWSIYFLQKVPLLTALGRQYWLGMSDKLLLDGGVGIRNGALENFYKYGLFESNMIVANPSKLQAMF